MAKDWMLPVDLKRQLRFPEDIMLTKLRPGIVIVQEQIEENHKTEIAEIHSTGRKMQGQRLENIVFSV